MIKKQLLQFSSGARFIQTGSDASNSHSPPYGSDWDLLLLGHFGALSRADTQGGRYWVANDDATLIPDTAYIWRFVKPIRAPLIPPEMQGNFFRVIYEPAESRYTYAYAMSLQDAVKFLFHFSPEPNARMMDFAIGDFCSLKKYDAKCITVFPNLFDQYKPAGDLSKGSDRHVTDPLTENLTRARGNDKYRFSRQGYSKELHWRS